jgi:hypothetical protein
MRFSQDAAAIIRLETRQRELGFEPALLAAAHRELTTVTAVAARARRSPAPGQRSSGSRPRSPRSTRTSLGSASAGRRSRRGSTSSRRSAPRRIRCGAIAQPSPRARGRRHLDRDLRRLVTAFGPTGIPARIIEGVLPELGAYANELLAELRPGMTLELRAQRAKKDGKGVVEALDLSSATTSASAAWRSSRAASG